MALKAYFKGKTGFIFWLNVMLAIAVLISVPTGVLLALEYYTHHGEKVEVPNVVDVQGYDAMKILDERGLVAVVADSDYNAKAKPGVVLQQLPKAGSEVKGGRIVYLTLNRHGEAPVRMPDFVRNTTVRIAESQLKQMGFRLTATSYVSNEPKDLVIGIKQGSHNVYAGDMVSKDRALTIVAGGGYPTDTLDVDTFGIVDDGGFAIEL